MKFEKQESMLGQFDKNVRHGDHGDGRGEKSIFIS